VARTRLTNPQPLVKLKYNPYQVSFLIARRLRACPGTCLDSVGQRLTWSLIEQGPNCPGCAQFGKRPFRRLFIRAGRRGGKTRIGALSAIEEMIVPNSMGWCCAPSYPELEDYVMPAFFSQLPQAWFDHPLTEWSEDRYTLRLPNGATCQFRSLDDPNRAAGPGLHWAWLDEGRKMQELAWHLLMPTLTEFKGVAWITSSPDWGEDWCHKNFWLPAEQGLPGFWATSYRTVDNPIIDAEEVERARVTMPPELFRREYEASIEFPTGTIFGDLIERCDATDDLIRKWIPEWPAVDPSRPCVVGLDPGTDHPFAAAVVVVTPKGLVVVDEYLQRKTLFAVHAAAIKIKVGTLSPRYGIDPSQAQGAIELAQYGIYAQNAPNAVDAGIQRLYAWMASGQMLISRTRCPLLLKYLRQYRWAELQETKRGIPTDAQPFKKDDDLPDALRYAVMLWPELPAPGQIDGITDEKRNMSLLSDDAKRQLRRNEVKDEADKDGLVRVTDTYDVVYDEFTPQADAAGVGNFFS
jgi:hypothetical protein